MLCPHILARGGRAARPGLGAVRCDVVVGHSVPQYACHSAVRRRRAVSTIGARVSFAVTIATCAHLSQRSAGLTFFPPAACPVAWDAAVFECFRADGRYELLPSGAERISFVSFTTRRSRT